MTTLGQRLRRNFIAALVVHVALVAGIVLVEGFLSNARSSAPTFVELIVPADILGDLPKGEGYGKGEFAPPPPQPDAGTTASLPGETTFTPEERRAPTPKPVAKTVEDPGTIKVPTKTTKPKPTKKTTSAKPSTKTTTTKATATAPPSAGDIRHRFAKALQSSGSGAGTPYGDNRPAGGGQGRSAIPGSPDGSPNGVIGGQGAGTPFWWYYQQVHDRMYEAWEQPGEALNWDKRLMTTVLLRVARDGRVLDVSLRGSSGNKIMDDSALSAARKVPRLDPLPDGLGSETANITVNFQLES
jgi:TonB family protein